MSNGNDSRTPDPRAAFPDVFTHGDGCGAGGAAVSAATPLLPIMPPVSLFNPNDDDLLMWTRYLRGIAESCELNAQPSEPANPWETIGRLRGALETLDTMVRNRQARIDELRGRMRREYADEPRRRSWADQAADDAGKPVRGEL
jgi:hypothetical protein